MAILKKKSLGFGFVTVAAVMGIVAFVRYVLWASTQNALNSMVWVTLILGIVLDIVLFFYDNEYIVIASTGCYSIALFALLADSVGSFVDAFQGIVMFGDSSQVGTIGSICALIAICAVGSIVASFMKRVKV